MFYYFKPFDNNFKTRFIIRQIDLFGYNFEVIVISKMPGNYYQVCMSFINNNELLIDDNFKKITKETFLRFQKFADYIHDQLPF